MIPHPKFILEFILSMIMTLIYLGSILKKYKSFQGARFGTLKTPFGAME